MSDDIPAHVPPSLVFDFDYVAAPVGTREPQRENAALLSAKAPAIFFTPRNGGHWVVQSPAHTVEMFRRTEDFSSAPEFNPLRAWKPRMLPVQADPPDHAQYRKAMGAFFSPANMRRMEGDIRAIAREILDGIKGQGACDFVEEVGEVFPIRVFMRLVDAPLTDRLKLMELAQLFTRNADLDRRSRSIAGLAEYTRALFAARRERPGTDALSQFIASDFNGRPLGDDELEGLGALLFLAGLDTLRSAMSHIMLYLARNPQQYAKLVDKPERIAGAVEELLRIAGTSSPERALTRDLTFEGVEMKKGDRLIFTLPLMSFSGELNDKPEEVDFDREAPQHLIFGSGPHRCAGSHLARIEVRVLLEEWVKRFPVFSLDAARPAEMAPSSVWTPVSVPLVWPVKGREADAAA